MLVKWCNNTQLHYITFSPPSPLSLSHFLLHCLHCSLSLSVSLSQSLSVSLSHTLPCSLSLSLPPLLSLTLSLPPSPPHSPDLSLSASRSPWLSKLLLRKLVCNQFSFLKSKTKSLKPWIRFRILWLNHCCITILCNPLPLPPYYNGSVAWTVKFSYLYSYSLSLPLPFPLSLPLPFPLSLPPPLALLHPHHTHSPHLFPHSLSFIFWPVTCANICSLWDQPYPLPPPPPPPERFCRVWQLKLWQRRQE